ncbi:MULTISPECIES: hypothetical protein [unclassified Streptomyces]|uniref:hypothetical protein n=1 Tax=unclassified Streptomyces TaxID=2593676 RepID=UPI0006B01C04|nr:MULTISPECIES: hypothetical protein [unclassified Streptomyces]KOU78988.1 hypothetical protein ADK93_34905 [Streptomyces sp. XY58]KOV00644.1 hypothetical protein ADK89_33240 [Streptomyces sp. XY37]
MLRIIRTRTYDALHADRGEHERTRLQLDQAVSDLARQRAHFGEARRLTEAAAQELIEQAHAERDEARAERDKLRAELDAARAQVLLDAEDRVALRMLLRSVRKQAAPVDRVYALFHRGTLLSLHRSVEAAERAAEAEGAPRDGWTAHQPGAAFPPACEVTWRVQPLTVQGAPSP